MPSSSNDRLVVLRGGLVMPVTVIAAMIDLETRGCTFATSPSGTVHITPAALLTDQDRDFLT